MSMFTGLRESWQESMAPLHQRWAALQPREQRALGIAGVIVALLILVYGLWLPSLHAAQKAEASYETRRALLQQLQARSGPAAATGQGGSLLRVASDTAATSHLVLSRIEPEGNGGVRISLDKADFNAVAAWLAALSAQGVKVEEAQIEKQAEGGVSARLALTR